MFANQVAPYLLFSPPLDKNKHVLHKMQAMEFKYQVEYLIIIWNTYKILPYVEKNKNLMLQNKINDQLSQ